MRGMLADINVHGHLQVVRLCLEALDLWSLLEGAGVRFTTLADQGLRRDLDDRSLWEFCQQSGWVLFTNDKNNDGPHSLQATLDDSWRIGHLPVITLSNQGEFVRNRAYAKRVASDIADQLVGILSGEPLYRPRIFVPL